MAEARCPASCGELLQGWILGGEKLVSCPIAWYSEVQVSEGLPAADERPLSRRMLNQVIGHFGFDSAILPPLRIECRSTIPVAKGLASSTADIAATAVAAARWLNRTLDENTLARLCLRLEPTDSTVFKALTLFDHRHGSCRIPHSWLPQLDIIILESPHRLTTAACHRRIGDDELRAQAEPLDRVWRLFQQSCAAQSPRLLGEATTLSARARNLLLPKAAFETLLGVVEHHDLYGLNVAHSGTVVGLLLDPRRHDPHYILAALKEKGTLAFYPQQHIVQMVTGGVS
ncbi:GHMP family kinase ATP-binding protein [Acerihabitans arboris]|uniref:GHMP kinase n=1 Tax=Acerihabitans arboris TaxID=2691583 RepID=A0A845SKR8_9GAMM|nr:GHMP kinase [Acerihabitans arboris]NDL63211.1 GHMP kinase [Acerihabitans arboris]